MLVKLVDHKGEAVWINPIYVRAIKAKKNLTEVYIVPGSGSATGVIKLEQPLDEVAMQVNVGLLGEDAIPPDLGADANATNPGVQSAVNAAMMG